MALTTQSLISGQSFGTSTNIGNGKFSINPVTLADATTGYIINVQVTPGAGPVDPNAYVRIWYTTTMRTVTAANAPYTLCDTSRYVDKLIGQSGQVRVSVAGSKDSSFEVKTGNKLHCWVDAPKLETAASLTVDVVELPS
jgi:hypothetical protein